MTMLTHLFFRQEFESILICVSLFSLSSCVVGYHQEVTYQDHGIQIGIETDRPTMGPSSQTTNDHPARLTPEEVRILLGSILVSGYSGTIVGMFKDPPKIPVFSDTELNLISAPLADTLRKVGPTERVFFSILNSEAPYERDRTAGALFIRGPYMHFVLNDHYAYLRADTAGGEDYKDPQDLKGMKLWVAPPANAVNLPPDQIPKWNAFETVHISLNLREVLAARGSLPSRPETGSAGPQKRPDAIAEAPQAIQSKAQPPVAVDPNQDLRLQIRELTSSNLELRERLKEQTRAMEDLKRELDRLRQELLSSPSTAQPRQNAPSLK